MFPLLTKSEKWIKDITRYKAACDSLDEGKLKDKLIGYVNTFKSLSDVKYVISVKTHIDFLIYLNLKIISHL